MMQKRSWIGFGLSLLMTAGLAAAQNQNCPRANCPNPGQNCPRSGNCPRAEGTAGRGPAASQRGPAWRRGPGMGNGMGARMGAGMGNGYRRNANPAPAQPAAPPEAKK